MSSYENELEEIVAKLNRAAATSREPKLNESQNSASLDQLLAQAVRRSASDLLLVAHAPVALRINGSLTPPAGPILTADDTRSLLLPLLSITQQQGLQRDKSVDFCFTRDGIGRFRANIHYQRGTLAGSL